MKLHFVTFGKLKTPGLRETADHYFKRLGPWIEVQEHELKPIHVEDKAERPAIQLKEGRVLLEKLDSLLGPRDAYYLLDETGKSLKSQDWAELARRWEYDSIPQIALCVGGSLGFSPELRRKARGALSLGPQTLSHELARVVLLEQVYRAYSILRNHPYHNEGS